MGILITVLVFCLIYVLVGLSMAFVVKRYCLPGLFGVCWSIFLTFFLIYGYCLLVAWFETRDFEAAFARVVVPLGIMQLGVLVLSTPSVVAFFFLRKKLEERDIVPDTGWPK